MAPSGGFRFILGGQDPDEEDDRPLWAVFCIQCRVVVETTPYASPGAPRRHNCGRAYGTVPIIVCTKCNSWLVYPNGEATTSSFELHCNGGVHHPLARSFDWPR